MSRIRIPRQRDNHAVTIADYHRIRGGDNAPNAPDQVVRTGARRFKGRRNGRSCRFRASLCVFFARIDARNALPFLAAAIGGARHVAMTAG
jgi:hypothetical protein